MIILESMQAYDMNDCCTGGKCPVCNPPEQDLCECCEEPLDESVSDDEMLCQSCYENRIDQAEGDR